MEDLKGLNGLKLRYIKDTATHINELAIQMEWAFRNQDALKLNNQEKEEFFSKMVKEMEKSAEYLKNYIEV
ncbi:hypothetical protein Q5427_11145 [Brochothrix thermosphacta]|uniref:hypothetical protein n=1 Tax=Brochothrix thermosphacta TaxID=2756 RepID=UPI0027125195|nr:hypothetical protein [Brochothrix thermosphacta]MDO7864845.1 hypothetical protein [Brochothrix thermosphacta]